MLKFFGKHFGRSSGVSDTSMGSPQVDMFLPLDIFPMLFRHLSQADLCTCLRVCKTFHHMITSDEVLLARLQVITSFNQFRSYLKVGRRYYRVDYYSGIGQSDLAKFPYEHQEVVTRIKHQDRSEFILRFSAPPEQKASYRGSALFSESFMMGHQTIYAVHKFDVMLQLLEKLWKFVNCVTGLSTGLTQKIHKNMRKAIRRLKQHMKKNEKFGEFVMLQAGHTQWLKDVMNLRPEEEPESSSDEEPCQEIEEKDIGKVPVFYCKKCKWVVGGFTCRTVMKKGAPSCGESLVVQEDGSLRCPKGCGVMTPPICCRRWAMLARVDSKYDVSASTSTDEVSSKLCPIFNCTKCGFGVDGIRCYTCTQAGNYVDLNWFYRRGGVNVWTCPEGCGRKSGLSGGQTESGFIKCKCQGPKLKPMIGKIAPRQN